MIIESLGVYLPPKVVSTAEILRGCTNPVSFPLERMTGIKSRRMAGDVEFSIDLARKAITDCLDRSKYRPEDIDLLVCCNISRVDGPNHRTSFEPSTSIKLRREFGLTNAVVFDVSNACAGLFTGIAIAEGYLEAGAARCALVVSGEYITHLSRTAQKEIEGFMDPKMACLTVGDSGVALTLEPAANPQLGFQALNMYTLGRYSNCCIAKPTDRPHGGAIMVTDPIKSSAIAISQAVMNSTDVLERNGWPLDSFQHLIMHQTSETALNGAAREINQRTQRKVCHPGNVVSNLAERGNTATTTHFVALMDNILSNKIRTGDRLVFGISGSGQTTGAALYVLDDLPDRIRRMKLGRRAPAKAVLEPLPRPHGPKRVRIESVGTVPANEAAPLGTLPLVKAAAEDCLARSMHDRSDIDLLLFTGVYRDEFICEPAIATMAAGELKMNDTVESPTDKKTFAFDLLNGSLGFLNACHLGVQMIRAEKSQRVMVATSEVENNVAVRPAMRRGVKETGAALILDAADGSAGFGNFVFRYVTEHIGDLETYTGFADGKTYLHTDKAGDLESHCLEAIPAAVRELLASEGLDLSRIKTIFPPQMGSGFVARLADKLEVSRDRFVDLAEEGQDFFTSSLACTLRHALDNGLVQAGDIGLLISAGSGIQVGCALYYF